MQKKINRVWLLLSSLLAAVVAAVAWVWFSVPLYPDVQQAEFSCDRPVKDHASTDDFKVISFNVQFMAGKNYVFFFDMDGGQDSRPSLEDMALTTERVAAIIRDENPDVVLLQELNDETDVRTHYRDQLAELQASLEEKAFPCQASSYYWRAGYIPHPNINGPVGMKLVTLSRYPIVAATRYQLPRMPMDPVSQHFYFQRAVLETHIEYQGRRVALLNTHFDAWGDGTGVLPGQVAVVSSRVKALQQQGIPWVVGGDFNMLPPDGERQWQQLKDRGTGSFDAQTPIKPLYDQYGAIPSLADLLSDSASEWYTHFPNDTRVNAPDRTIDYVFYSDHWRLNRSYIRHGDSWEVSDHLPVVGEFSLVEAGIN